MTEKFIIQDVCFLNPNEKLSMKSMIAVTHRFIDNHWELWLAFYGFNGFTKWIGTSMLDKKLPTGYSMALVNVYDGTPNGSDTMLVCENTKSWTEEELYAYFNKWPKGKPLKIIQF